MTGAAIADAGVAAPWLLADDGEYAPDSAERQAVWWVVHTRPRCEKKMDRWFALAGCAHYLPVRPSLRIYKSKRVTFDKPLFPGYAFGAFPCLARTAVYGSEFAASLLAVKDQAAFLAQLTPIREALERGAPLDDHPYMAEGQRVRITTGKFRGIEGIVTRFRNRTRVCLSVEILERSVAFEVEAAMLAPAV